MEVDSITQTSSSIHGLNICFRDKVLDDTSLHLIKMYLKIAWENNKNMPKIYYNRHLIDN